MQMTQCQPATTATPQQNSGRTNNHNRPCKYCHTHGYCTHDGAACNNKGPNHKDKVTLVNNKGGSDKNIEK